MNTKGKMQVEQRKRAEVSKKLETVLRGMGDREAVETFRDFAALKGKVEEAVFPLEFLDVIRDTAFMAITDYLERSGAPREVVSLVEDVIVLDVWMGEVEKGGKVGWHVNRFLPEAVASASRNIAACGGRFFSPHGETKRREVLKCEVGSGK